MTELQTTLSKCRIADNIVFLPSPKDYVIPNYQEVRNALLKAGAKYKSNTFVFPNAAQPYIDRLMGGDKVNIKKEFQFYGTPAWLAKGLVEMANIKMQHRILEPSAGQGAIITAIGFAAPGIRIDYCELMDINRNVLKMFTSAVWICDDFLKIPDHYLGYYDRIVANPPFNKNLDIDHIKKMYDCLKDGGRLVSIASQSWKTGNQKKQVAFREWIDYVEADIEEVEMGSFKESGTSVGGYIITIDK